MRCYAQEIWAYIEVTVPADTGAVIDTAAVIAGEILMDVENVDDDNEPAPENNPEVLPAPTNDGPQHGAWGGGNVDPRPQLPDCGLNSRPSHLVPIGNSHLCSCF